MNRYEQRRDRLRRLLKNAGTGALLITSEPNVTYLTGFTGDDSFLWMDSRGARLLSDPRYTQQLEEECPGLDLLIRKPGGTMLDSIKKVGGNGRALRLGVEAETLSVAWYERLAALLPSATLKPVSGLVEQLREIKDRDEVRRIRDAVHIAQRAFEVIRAALRGEQTELEVAHHLEHQIRLFGGTACSFDPIVAVGPRAALPHARPTDRRIGESDFVLIDWGATRELYRSDLTRVLVTGRISPKLERIYGVVLKAQRRAIAAIRPGARMCDVDSAARKVITEAGFGRRFGHGLGHGIGLEIHEAPRLAANQDRRLKAGMVVTVEPGIYVPQWGGVRIEDDVLVTKDGHEVLSSLTTNLQECVVP